MQLNTKQNKRGSKEVWKCQYGNVRRRDESHITRTVLDMEVERVRPRGRPKLRYMDTIRRYIKKNALTDVSILNRTDWRLAVSRATHWRGRAFKVRKEKGGIDEKSFYIIIADVLRLEATIDSRARNADQGFNNSSTNPLTALTVATVFLPAIPVSLSVSPAICTQQTNNCIIFYKHRFDANCIV